ncbi:melanoma-associated antigen B1-like [Orycteropus afer afer]|uniref:Melanoma-associated antigen B1-like n=1 Tax=Orycteropus afer afer TaxID=1230840 RepID=A0AC54Z7B7_ORYAF|nr:melanoma-associated antigen B1-like [Orycteropus afer afer]
MPRGQKSKLRAREKRRQARGETHGTEGAQASVAVEKANMLVQFLLDKYRTKEIIGKGEMLKVVNRRYKEHFPEILKKTADRMELVFGLVLKEVRPRGQSYTIVSQLDISNQGTQSSDGPLPRNGLLMPLLGMIFMNNNRATEEEVWEFLNMVGVYDGKKHYIFGEPRKLITEDFIKAEYLKYQLVPNSDPPCHEFLWGPRAYAETSKMKVLEFLAKINDTIPSAFSYHYEEALREEQERAKTRVVASADPTVKAKASAEAKANSFSSFAWWSKEEA